MKLTHLLPADRRWAPGFTIIEIIVSLIIISILTLVLVPVVSNRSRQANIAAAQQEVDHIAAAQERLSIDTGYYVRLYALDDVAGGDGIPNEASNNIVDGTQDIDVSTVHTSPTSLFIDVQTQLVITDPTLYTRMTQGLNAETNFGWHGPYMNWKRDVNSNDWPDDPWGHDYILFSKAGGLYAAIPSNLGNIGVRDDQFVQTGPSIGTAGISPRADVFDRPTVLSLGPDGYPGDLGNTPYGTGDDIFRSF